MTTSLPTAPSRLDELIKRVEVAMATSANDDLSVPGTRERARHVKRMTVMGEIVESLRSGALVPREEVERLAEAEYSGLSGCGVKDVRGSAADISLVKQWCEQAATIPYLQERIRAAEARALAAEQARPGWQPIETAPRRQEVLIATRYGAVGEAMLTEDCWHWVRGDAFRHDEPTCWQPLPPPPAEHGEG